MVKRIVNILFFSNEQYSCMEICTQNVHQIRQDVNCKSYVNMKSKAENTACVWTAANRSTEEEEEEK